MRLPHLLLPIDTRRLVLRPMTLSDGDARFALHSDPDYVRFIGQAIDRERCDRELARELEGKADLQSAAISLKGEEIMIGECVLLPSTVGEVELVIALLPSHRGQRYSGEVAEAAIRACFAGGDISTVIACVEDDNELSQRLVRSLGMVPEGRMPRLGGAMPQRYVIKKVVPGA